MTATRRPRYAVQCGDWTTKDYPTKAAAERRLAQIEQAGNCRNEHKVVEVYA